MMMKQEICNYIEEICKDNGVYSERNGEEIIIGIIPPMFSDGIIHFKFIISFKRVMGGKVEMIFYRLKGMSSLIFLSKNNSGFKPSDREMFRRHAIKNDTDDRQKHEMRGFMMDIFMEM